MKTESVFAYFHNNLRNGRNTSRLRAWFNLIFAISYLCRKYDGTIIVESIVNEICDKNPPIFGKGQKQPLKGSNRKAKIKKDWWFSWVLHPFSRGLYQTWTAAARAHSSSFTAAQPTVHWRATSKSAEKCKQKPWTLVGKGVTPSITWKNLSNGSRQIQILPPFYHNVVFIPHTMWLSLGEVLSDWQLLKKW